MVIFQFLKSQNIIVQVILWLVTKENIDCGIIKNYFVLNQKFNLRKVKKKSV